MAAWAGVESAKRQLVFQLDQLGLPRTGGADLVFDLLSSAAGPVTTGHADGVVTIDLAEGADQHRESLAFVHRRVTGVSTGQLPGMYESCPMPLLIPVT